MTDAPRFDPAFQHGSCFSHDGTPASRNRARTLARAALEAIVPPRLRDQIAEIGADVPRDAGGFCSAWRYVPTVAPKEPTC